MRILSIRPAPPGAGTRTIAHFDVEAGPHLRLYNLTLRRLADGRYRIVAPNACGKHAASFHPELAAELSSAAAQALSELEAAKPYERPSQRN
ncbi:hypothetical protein VSX64_13270 [Aurantimonas sp. C2-6-R+9]|uniref:hypothetical protein n=1 Tax=unclassified Aurantimonas TaxID=2638230 RepID=UPI002E1706C1|nr:MULTISPECIES: hypothetical protein [unclassified Aurantimonas]MEC5291658.1 hypothetical protein [Aurantimonas sp. C2-3-R2]MEC5381840.1 hypothetical protein [Aurantimonas sp. C2-6-R+9]MEC5412742.1 hypothetical protein [Aurantimonas sp. C2-4-R8]